MPSCALTSLVGTFSGLAVTRDGCTARVCNSSRDLNKSSAPRSRCWTSFVLAGGNSGSPPRPPLHRLGSEKRDGGWCA